MSARQNFIAALTNIVIVLIIQSLLFKPVLAAQTTSTTTVNSSSKSVKVSPVVRAHTPHRASTGVATLHVYTKASDLRSDSLTRHLLKSAFGADSPDSNPDGQDRSAANLDLDVNETLIANLFRQHNFDPEQLLDIDKGNIVLGNLTRGNLFHLSMGNAPFIPKKDIVVQTDLAEIHVGAGSMVGVLKPGPGVVSIYDLEDTGNKKVSVKVGNESINLSPGKHLILSKEAGEFEKINPARRIAYRRPESKTLKCGLYAYTTEFSIASAVLHVKPLQNILLSDDPEDKKIAGRLLKDFVILGDVYSNTEPYKMPASIVTPLKISNK